MLRISRLTDYATVILASLAGGGLASATDIAGRTHIGLPTVSKLLKELQHAGLVRSVRGARGGYQLARAPAAISAAAIIDAVEGPDGVRRRRRQLRNRDDLPRRAWLAADQPGHPPRARGRQPRCARPPRRDLRHPGFLRPAASGPRAGAGLSEPCPQSSPSSNPWLRGSTATAS
jgi:Rrf2 family protein